MIKAAIRIVKYEEQPVDFAFVGKVVYYTSNQEIYTYTAAFRSATKLEKQNGEFC